MNAECRMPSLMPSLMPILMSNISGWGGGRRVELLGRKDGGVSDTVTYAVQYKQYVWYIQYGVEYRFAPHSDGSIIY